VEKRRGDSDFLQLKTALSRHSWQGPEKRAHPTQLKEGGGGCQGSRGKGGKRVTRNRPTTLTRNKSTGEARELNRPIKERSGHVRKSKPAEYQMTINRGQGAGFTQNKDGGKDGLQKGGASTKSRLFQREFSKLQGKNIDNGVWWKKRRDEEK